jgi:hypothetical protein
MSLKTFNDALKMSLHGEAKYVFVCLSIFADQFGRITNFSTRMIEEFCDLGSRTVKAALEELSRLKLINIHENFAQLMLPGFENKGGHYE